MGTSYLTPGVFVEETPKLPSSVAAVETAIPAFIGYTQKAMMAVAGDLLLVPTRIDSMAAFEAHFGAPQPETKLTVAITATSQPGGAADSAVARLTEGDRSKHILHYALQLFFANGGAACFIVSIGDFKSLGAALVTADFHAGLAAIEAEDAPTLIVMPEATHLGIADFKALMDAALAQSARLMDRFVIIDAHGDGLSLADPGADLLAGVRNFRDKGVGTLNLSYGAAYVPHLKTALDFAYAPADVQVIVTTDGVAGATTDLATLAATNPTHFALAEAAIGALVCTLPPSAAVAGIYAAVDRERGVWKAPANVSLAAVTAPAIRCSDATQAAMNIDAIGGKSVNAIRAFPGKGTLVWGARTLSGNDNEWRYVSVRRLFVFVEESVKKATQPFVFEPNDANTWVRVQAMIENFLTTLWRQGAFAGAKPEQAFFVAVGLGSTMTELDILEGRLIVQIGLAAVRPAEFIIARFAHTMESA